MFSNEMDVSVSFLFISLFIIKNVLELLFYEF